MGCSWMVAEPSPTQGRPKSGLETVGRSSRPNAPKGRQLLLALAQRLAQLFALVNIVHTPVPANNLTRRAKPRRSPKSHPPPSPVNALHSQLDIDGTCAVQRFHDELHILRMQRLQPSHATRPLHAQPCDLRPLRTYLQVVALRIRDPWNLRIMLDHMLQVFLTLAERIFGPLPLGDIHDGEGNADHFLHLVEGWLVRQKDSEVRFPWRGGRLGNLHTLDCFAL